MSRTSIRTDFPYETRREDVRIPMPGGTSQAEGSGGGVPLYARVWRPVTEEPVRALLEYLPYRLTDWTAPRDHQRHLWVRGALPGDEYDVAEPADGVAVVNWLAEQPWRTGSVGMSEDAVAWEEPEQAEPLEVVYPASPEERRPERVVVRDVAKGEWRLEVDPKYGGTRVYPDGLEFTEDALETYTIEESGPLTARTRSDWTIRLRRPDRDWDVGVETRSEITCDAEAFHTSNGVVCREGDEVVFHRTWEKRIPRTAG
ncbi:hypothetical protein ACOZE3_21920 [Streptomyces cinereoruber]|uniref:hypothetical protein n=1 Tax=Streptomyces cinereoruber TaxID=67260 RepID=UPI003BF46A57